MEQVVYFIRCGDFVKIGTTGDIKQRLRSLQSCCPYEMKIEGTISGSHCLEGRLHWENSNKHHCGEWYKMTKEDVHVAIGSHIGFEKKELNFCDEVIRIGSVNMDGFLSGTELVKIGNKFRVKNGKPQMSILGWMTRDSTKMLIDDLVRRFVKHPVVKVARCHTWVHPVLFIDLALMIEPTFLGRGGALWEELAYEITDLFKGMYGSEQWSLNELGTRRSV